MSIYLAYRTGYKSNNRYLKKFNYNSILDFFRDNWEKLIGEENESYIELFGERIYGFPIFQLSEDYPIPNKPSTNEELFEIIRVFVYNNEVIGNEDCIQVFTDDDEIELAWYIFIENYKTNNPYKVKIWFEKNIPINYGEIGKSLEYETNIIQPEIQEGKGKIYFISCPIEDSESLSSLDGIYEINGIRLPELLEYLRANEINYEEEDKWIIGLRDLKYIQHIARQIPNGSIDEILSFIVKYPLGELGGSDFEELSLKQIEEVLRDYDSKKSFFQKSKHFYEISMHHYSYFYNYMIIFDDLWLEKNEELGLSIAIFANTNKI